MRVQLKNIGIVNNSSIELEGLTVITGKNNSGKTTVGKAIYSLLDATSNLSNKSRNDRIQYISDCLRDVVDTLDFFRFLVHSRVYEKENQEELVLSQYPNILSVLSYDYRHEVSRDDMEKFAKSIERELEVFDVKKVSSNPLVKDFTHHFYSKNDVNNTENIIEDNIKKAKKILKDMFVDLEKDPQLIDYARESINQTLLFEFSGQIQPASKNVDVSSINIYDEDTTCFAVEISNNKVIKNGQPVFFTTPYKRAFFIDNPFIFDELFAFRKMFVNSYSEDTVFDINNVVSHNSKLKNILRHGPRASILEKTIIDESLKIIKAKIDDIIPGTFEFSQDGDFYVKEGTKLKVTNLATGSKMFSIIKILLEKGLLNDSTMLVLDEPEAHLHPKWQNKFAELMVLLVKELGVNILLTTHSSNFVLAIDAYMRKYQIEEITNFYRTEFNEIGMVDYKCINDDIGLIYQDFLEYFSEVKILRNELIKQAGDSDDN